MSAYVNSRIRVLVPWCATDSVGITGPHSWNQCYTGWRSSDVWWASGFHYSTKDTFLC